MVSFATGVAATVLFMEAVSGTSNCSRREFLGSAADVLPTPRGEGNGGFMPFMIPPLAWGWRIPSEHAGAPSRPRFVPECLEGEEKTTFRTVSPRAMAALTESASS